MGNLGPYLIIGVLALGLGTIVWRLLAPPDQVAGVEVTVPGFSALAQTGAVAFAANCAACHGSNASGSTQGRPLVHDIYNPGHHADGSFFAAMTRGVRGHHWPFGNMPPQPQVSRGEAVAIVKFVRELQLANGITYRRHRM